MKKINEIIQYYIQKKSFNRFLIHLSNLFLSLLFLFIIIVFLENIFFLEQSIKLKIVYLSVPILLSVVIYIILKFIFQYFSLFGANNKFNIAIEIGEEFNSIKDQLLNVLQIKNQENSTNEDLKNYATENLLEKLLKIAKTKIKFNFPKKLLRIALILGFIFVILLASTPFRNATYRIIKYDTHFDPPFPFILKSTNKNINALSSDTININIAGLGELPDSIYFHWIEDNIKNTKTIKRKNKSYKYQFNNIHSHIIYWADYKSHNFLSSWNKISTKKHSIEVKQRPVIENLIFTAIPPPYTKDQKIIYKLTNSNQINLLNGSRVIIEAITNKNLDSAWLLNDQQRINLTISENKIIDEINVNTNMTFSIHCLDKDLIPNSNSKQYNIIVNNDLTPNISIQSPNDRFEIDESMIVPVIANINDDYGLTQVGIEYQIISQDFPEFSNDMNKIIIDTQNTYGKSFNINMNWDIANISISMGDELHFKIIAIDNNNIDGYQISESPILIGKFPDLDDLFSEINELEYETEEIIDDIESSLEEISDIAEDVKMELLKSDKPTWEQEKKLEQTFEEIDDISTQIEKIQENIEKILEKADKNQLFSNELMDKFEKFQNLLDNIMSEELYEAMENLQNALEKLDMNQITQALDNYNFNIEQFEEQIDRYMSMFETAMAEQKLNELAEHIENMIEKQTDIINDIDNNQDEYVLNRKSNKQEKRYQDFKELLNETANSIKNINENGHKNLNDISLDPIIEETENMLKNQTENIKENNLTTEAQSAKNNMNEIATMVEEVQNQFQNEITRKLTKEFIIIIDNLLSISNQQEQLIEESKTVRSNSPSLKIINRKQDGIDRQLNQITKQLIDLSNSTFFVNPQINRLIGKLKSSISDIIANFEQKKISNGKKQQLESLKNLNTITFLLLLSMEEMQNSNSASGYEKFMESLEKMSNQQQGINQGTMQLGQFGMMQQKLMMQQLLEQQQQLQQQLEQLIGDNPGEETGGLSKANEDMEEVISDFQKNNITRKTHDRQQKILSRMLDSQKSLTQKDYSKKRKSKTSSDFDVSSINEMPNNYGERDLFYINAMESALDKGLPKEYQKITRIYFLNLQEETLNEIKQ